MFFTTCLGASAFASALEVRLVAGFFIDRDNSVRVACFVLCVIAVRVIFVARLAGLPVTLLALRATFATCLPGGLARPKAITFLAPLALAFAATLLTGGNDSFAMVGQRV